MAVFTKGERDLTSFLLKGRLVGVLQYTGTGWHWHLENRRGKKLDHQGWRIRKEDADADMRAAHRQLLKTEEAARAKVRRPIL